MLLKVLYFCLGINFYAIQAKNVLPMASDKFSCTTADCLFSQSQPNIETGPTIDIKTHVPEGETPKVLPPCSDIIPEGVTSTKVRVGIDCIDVGIPTPSVGCVKSPSEPTSEAKPPVQALDYRWEDYNGTPPEDAFEIHYQGFSTQYIGQVEIPGAGACIGILKAGEMEIQVSCGGYYEKTDNIKILCVGHETYYGWKETQGEEEFRAVIKDNELVKGGYNETKKVDTFVGAYDAAPLLIGNIDKEEGTICYGHYDETCTSAKDDTRIYVLIYKPTEGEPPKKKPFLADWEMSYYRKLEQAGS